MPARDVRPPDLEMRVRTVAESGRVRLSYMLHSPNGAVEFAHREIAGPAFQGSPEAFQSHWLQKMERLVLRQDVDGSWLATGELERKLAGLGRDLWRELIPLEIRQAYREIRRCVRSWMIVSDEPWIPWELIKPYDDSLPEDVIDDDFLALRFELTRWLAGARTPARRIAVRQLAGFRTASDLPHARQERKVLQHLAQSHPDLVDATPAVESAAAVLSCLETRDLDLLHFIGHGTPATAQPEESAIPFPDSSVLRPVDLEGPLATRIGRTRPLVFLNACCAGQQGWSLTRLGGWAARWVGVCGCGAFIAPMWPVRDKTALAFAEAFYNALSGGATLGEATLAARRHVVEARSGDASTLAYTIYGHPNARLVFAEEADFAPEAEIWPGPLRPAKVFPSSWRDERWLWQSLRERRRWLAAALCGVLLVLPVAMRGRFAEIVDWMERRGEAPIPHTEGAKKPAPLERRSPAQPASQMRQAEERNAPSGKSAPPVTAKLSTMIPSSSAAGGSGEAVRFEIAAGGTLKAALAGALKEAAAPLMEMGIQGWTLRVDVDALEITPHIQDGFPWLACRLTASCRARRQGEILDLGAVSAVRSQADDDKACEEAAKALGEAVIYRFVTSWREQYASH